MQPFQFENPRHKEIYDKLKFIGPGPAAYFKDAIKILFDENYNLESEVHLVAHLFREIESSVRNAIRLPEEKKDTHKEDIEYILDKLGIPADHPVGKAWIQFASQDFELQFNKLVHRNSLLNPKRRRKEIIESWENFLEILDLVIEKAKQNYFHAVDFIDEILGKEEPNLSDVKTLVNNVPLNNTTLSYLFDNCNNPKWLPLLRQKGFFQHPPPTIYNEDGSWRYPSWPAGDFIQKMAPKRPHEVSEIIREMPDTENRNAIDDLVFALGSVPAKIASQHIQQVLGWAEKGSLSYRAEPYHEYALHLAEHEFTDEALQVLKVLLSPDYPEEPEVQHGLQRSMGNYLKISDFEFRTFFDKELQQFVPHLGFDLVKLFPEILDEILTFSYTEPPNDGSNVWMSEINFDEPESSGYRHEVKETLVDVITSLSWKLINQKVITSTEVTEYLDDFNWQVFQRINVLFFSKTGQEEKIREILLTKAHFYGYNIHIEYRILLNRHFLSLSEADRQTVLGWIEEGPKEEDVMHHFKHWDDAPTDEKVAKYKRHWQCRKLFPIADFLKDQWKAYYDELIEEFGEPNFEQSKPRSFVGSTTPKTIPELEEFTVSELINYLKNWQPEEGFAKPTPEGLGRALSSLIAEKAEAYSKQALRFKDLEPTYVRSLFEGLRSALENSEAIEWEPVLELAEWVLQQPTKSSSNDDGYESKDPNWSWTRKTIARVLELGCGRTTSGLSFSFRDRVWSCIEILTEDPNPDEVHEATYGGSNMDPATPSINTVRGKAMHAVIYYGWWVKRHLDGDDQQASFDHMPEIRTVLERHLDLLYDPSKAIRSVYGQFIPSLFQFDKDWLKDHLYDIFPIEQEHLIYFLAAWNSYISFNKPNNEVFEILAPVYALALEKMTAEDPENYLRSRRRLVQHLMNFYWREVITVDGKHSELVHTFWNEVPEDLRGHAFEFTGRCLNEWTDAKDVDHELLARMEDYIRLRIETIKKNMRSDLDYNKELAAYGWCFTSDKLDHEQRIQHLHDILKITGNVDHSHAVMGTLHNEFAEENPEEVLECVTLMVKGADKNIRFFGWKRDLKGILEILLNKEEPIAKKAKGLVQYICQESYHLMQEFKPLLDK